MRRFPQLLSLGVACALTLGWRVCLAQQPVPATPMTTEGVQTQILTQSRDTAEKNWAACVVQATAASQERDTLKARVQELEKQLNDLAPAVKAKK